MALKNESGHYLQVTRVDALTNSVSFQVFKSSVVRNSPSDFDRALEKTMTCAKIVDEGQSYESTGNLFYDLKKVGYLALKHEPPFNGASGETWTDC